MLKKQFKTIILTVLLTSLTLIGYSQKVPVFSVGEDTVYSEEFLRVFDKNNKEKIRAEEELSEYLDLYVKFKLKISEAYDLQMDTVDAFVRELDGYRKELARPYLTDKEVNQRLIDEAYQRYLYDVNASHIMVSIPLEAAPQDSLKAYNKAMALYKKAINDNYSFDSLARQNSEDPSAQSNYGNLGWFTVFQMVYPFESAAFELEPGEISAPVRSRFGYHIVKLNNKRPNPGEVRAAHIMIRFNNEGEVQDAKSKADAVYEKLQGGAAFTDMVEQHTEDFNTRSRGGELNWIKSTTNNVPAAFKDALFALENNGDFTQPIKTEFGWHIIKKLDTRPVPTKEELEPWLKMKVSRDQRSNLNKKAVLARIKKENNFVESKVSANRFAMAMKGELGNGDWKANDELLNNKKLFSIADRTYTWKDFAAYLEEKQPARSKVPSKEVAEALYTTFVEDMNMQYEDEHLEEKYPDFRYLMQEYRDGILLFELSDKRVWSKSVDDTTGLQAFYQDHQNEYMWNKRIDATVYTASSAKIRKKAKKLAKKGMSSKEIRAKFTAGDALALKVYGGYFEKGKIEDVPALEDINWVEGYYDLPESENSFPFVHIKEVLPAQPKSLDETRGAVTSAYQEELEKQWLQNLRNTYKVWINPSAISELKQL